MSGTGLQRIVGLTVATLALPVALAALAVRKRLRAEAGDRFCGGNWRKILGAQNKGGVWLHAASVGEVEGLAPVLKQLRQECPGVPLVVTTTTETGREAVLSKKLAEECALLPYDHPILTGHIVSRLRPKLFLLFETELWPNLLLSLQARGVPVVIVNGRISDRSYPRYRRLRWLFAPILERVARCFAQGKEDANRFTELGVPAAKVEAIGSTKYDQTDAEIPKDERDAFARSIGILPELPCFVAGSVRPGEDEEVVKAYRDACEAVPGLQMIIAPRHPDRFEEVAKQLQKHKVEFHRRTSSRAESITNVLLLDSLGELRKAYSLGTVAFVGGTLVNIGGHNPMEPAMFRCPVILGPYVSNIRDAVSQLQGKGGMVEVKSAEELSRTLIMFYHDRAKQRQMGEAAYAAWSDNRGSTKRVVKEAGDQIGGGSVTAV